MAGNLNQAISKDTVQKARQARAEALQNGRQFSTKNIAQKQLGAKQKNWDWGGFRQGADAGARMLALAPARFLGSQRAAEQIEKLKQEGAYNSKDRWTNPFGGDVLQTAGVAGDTAAGAIALIVALTAAPLVGGTAIGYAPAGTALKTIGTGAARLGWKGLKYYGKNWLPAEAASGAISATGRAMHRDKAALADAFQTGDPGKLTEAQRIQYTNMAKELGPYNPQDPASVQRYRKLGQDLQQQYNRRMAGWAAASMLPYGFGIKGLLKNPKNWKSYIGPVFNAGLTIPAVFSQLGSSGDARMSYDTAAALSRDPTQTQAEQVARRQGFVEHALGHTTVGRIINGITGFKTPYTPSNHLAMHAVAQQGAISPQQAQKRLSGTQQQTLRQWAKQQFPQQGYTSNRFVQSAVASALRTPQGRQKLRQSVNDQFKLYADLNNAKTPQERQAILKRLRASDKTWTAQDKWGFSQGNRQKIVLLQHMNKDPQLQREALQDIVNKSPQQLEQMLNGYEQLWNDKQYLQIQKNMPQDVKQALKRQRQYLQTAITQNFQKNLPTDMQDLDNYLQRYYKLSRGGKLPQETRKKVQQALWQASKKSPLGFNKAIKWFFRDQGMQGLADFVGNDAAFYGTLVGLPLTIGFMSSLFGGNKGSVPIQQATMQGYQPMAYAPKGITERGLIVG